jgi:lipid-binding SYLF domain-containing protein
MHHSSFAADSLSTKEEHLHRILLLILVILVAAMPAHSQLDDKVADRLYESATILDALINAPDGEIPTDLLSKAECVGIIPAVKKAAIGFGGQYGRGVVSCRVPGQRAFGSPSMLALSGGSFGFQLGGQSIDVVMLFMTPDSVKHLLRDKVTLGADIGAAVGPKGRNASAETSASMRAEILTYARSRGLFAGISLNGAVLQPDRDANRSLYQREIPAEELLIEGKVAVPQPAQKLIETLTRTAGK